MSGCGDRCPGLFGRIFNGRTSGIICVAHERTRVYCRSCTWITFISIPRLSSNACICTEDAKR